MLAALHIENMAVVKCADIDLRRGFTALTGETGAGKSIIIGSVALLLGGRADREIVRSGEEQALVSGVFCDLPEQTVAALKEIGAEVDGDGAIMLSRTVSRDGKSVCRIGGRTVTASYMRDAAMLLVNIHGQHDNTALLNEANHAALLDRYASDDAERAEYYDKYKVLTALRSQYETLLRDERESAELVEVLTHKAEEIAGAKLKAGEDATLEAERNRLSSIERIEKQAGLAYRALYGAEKGNASYITDRSAAALMSIADAVPEAGALAERLRAVKIEIDDISESLTAFIHNDENPTERLDRINSRLDTIDKLKKKYGDTIEDIIAFYDKTKARLDSIADIGGAKDELSAKITLAEEQARAYAAVLTNRRRNAAKKLSHDICDCLGYLDMPKVKFEISVTQNGTLAASGADDVVFLISTSPGDSPGPLSKIASGGELSRIMLAAKSALSVKEGADTVIYDEIDAGVSGRTARRIGMKLAGGAKETQVICVTHSAQIASLADTHLLVEKREADGRFESAVRELDRQGRVDELSRILGGLTVTEAQRKAAVDLLNGDAEEQ